MEDNAQGMMDDLVPETVVYDARSGDQLDLNLVKIGRLRELDQMAKHQVYREVPSAQAWGRKVKAKWVDEARTKDGVTEVRSRLVAMEFNVFARDDVNASTPPLAVIRAIISLAASKPGERFLAVYDISVAFFHAVIDEDITVMPPRGTARLGYVWILLKAMYGTRRAAQLWQEHLATVFKNGNWLRLQNIAGAFYEPNLDVTVAIHGDDFLAEGTAESLNVLDQLLLASMDVKVMPRIGPGAASSGRYLKRVIRWIGSGFTWEADPKHVGRVLELLDLGDAKPADTPGTKSTGVAMRDSLEPLVGDELAMFPQIGGLLNYVAIDRPDIQYSVKCVLNDIHSPIKRSLLRAKRIGRYLKGKPVLEWHFPKQSLPKRVVYQSDSDWAEDTETRKSTTCVFGYFGSHLLETQVATQAVVALSSGEAEFYAVGRAAASAIMMRQFYEQVGLPVRAVIQSDSSAARGMASRIGCGKIRHLQIRDLWIQERVRSGDLLLEKALTADNTSDLGTKHIDAKRIEKLVGLAGMRFRVGEAGQAALKGLAVGALLARQTVVAAAAAPGHGLPDFGGSAGDADGAANFASSDMDQDAYMSLTTLLLLAFALGACSMALLLCTCWCWCRKRHLSPSMQALVDSTSGRHGSEETAAVAASRLPSASGSSTGRPYGSDETAAVAASRLPSASWSSTGRPYGSEALAASRLPSASGSSTGRPYGSEVTAAAAVSQLSSASIGSTGRPFGSKQAAAVAAPASNVLRARTSCSTRGSAMVFRTLAAQLETLTVKELKDELRNKQLPVGGLKADLVARLVPVLK